MLNEVFLGGVLELDSDSENGFLAGGALESWGMVPGLPCLGYKRKCNLDQVNRSIRTPENCDISQEQG